MAQFESKPEGMTTLLKNQQVIMTALITLLQSGGHGGTNLISSLYSRIAFTEAKVMDLKED